MKLIHRIAAAAMAAGLLLTGASQAHAGSANSSTNWQLVSGTTHGSTGLAGFDFTTQEKTRLLSNSKDTGLLGDHAGGTMSATASISHVTGDFTYYGEGTASNPCTTPATVRLYFESIPSGAKFAYTNYWWSNPVSASLVNGDLTGLTTTIDAANWSDWNGQRGDSSSDVTTAFNAAAANITKVGLSFGGGCFFENGVGTSDGSGTFTLNTLSVG